MKEKDKLLWECFGFYELSGTLLYNLLAERAKVFIIEQNCIFNDVDGLDIKSYHLFGFYDRSIACYARLVPPGEAFNEMSIGRIMTPQAYRGKGIGKLVVEQAIDKCYDLFGEGDIKILAQVYLKKFYEYFGFKESGPPFDLDGIMHLPMLRKR